TFIAPSAAEKLASMKPKKEHRPVVAQKLAAKADWPTPFLRQPVVHALAVWATEKEVPTLIKALAHTDIFTRREALKDMGKLRDKRTVAPVVQCFENLHTRSEAAGALRDLGPMAEKDVIDLVERSNDVTKRPIEVLESIGTEASVPMLTRLA